MQPDGVPDSRGSFRSGGPVNTYEEFVEYLQAKHPAIRTGKLAFESRNVTKCADVAARARSIVLYMLPEDYG